MSAHVDIATISRDYGEAESSKSKGAPDSAELLHITRPTVEPIPRMPKAYTKRTTINPNAKATQNYSIVEDLGKFLVPCLLLRCSSLVQLSEVLSSLLLELLI